MARRALGPATLAVVQAVDASLDEHDTALLAACSGGADSLALAFAVRHVAGRRDLPDAAAVVDHGLQPGSADVADRARAALIDLGYRDVVVLPVRVDPDGSGPRAAAERGATLLLGHTLDDQAETVLLGLARGSGTRSLAGMAVRSAARLRPLLGLRRSTTRQACAELGLRPWDDPHNADPAYARVRVRSTVLPVLEAELGPGFAPALARTAALARADADLLDALADDAAQRVRTPTGGLSCAAAADLPDALRTRVLHRWLRDRGARDLARSHVDAVDALVTRWRGQGPLALPGLTVARRSGVLDAL